ncbi:transposase [Gemmatimonadota bacterium]
MRTSRFTETQIVLALKQAEAGVVIAEICRKYGISQQTFYRWRKKYAGPEPSELKQLEQ